MVNLTQEGLIIKQWKTDPILAFINRIMMESQLITAIIWLNLSPNIVFYDWKCRHTAFISCLLLWAYKMMLIVLLNMNFFEISEASSTRIRMFLKMHLLSEWKYIHVQTRSVFEKISVHTNTLLHLNFAVRTSIKEQTIKMPLQCMIPKDPCVWSDTP